MSHIANDIHYKTIYLMRNTSIGLAAFSATAVLLLVETGINSTALYIALLCFAICIPVAIAWAGVLQVQLYAGPVGLFHYSKILTKSRTRVLVWICVMLLSFVAGISSIMWHLSVVAFIVFLSVSFVAYCFYAYYYLDLQRDVKVYLETQEHAEDYEEE